MNPRLWKAGSGRRPDVGRDISDWKHYENLRLQAFYQIEQNIEQFAILADYIRLPAGDPRYG